MEMLKENFEAALILAIRSQKERDKEHGGFFHSGFRAGMEVVLEASQRGEHIEIVNRP